MELRIAHRLKERVTLLQEFEDFFYCTFGICRAFWNAKSVSDREVVMEVIAYEMEYVNIDLPESSIEYIPFNGEYFQEYMQINND